MTDRIIAIWAVGDFQTGPAWLADFDADAPTPASVSEVGEQPDGTFQFFGMWGGRLNITADKAKAKRFPSFADAMAAWKTQSAVIPFRPDGLPNRPLTMLSIEVEIAP